MKPTSRSAALLCDMRFAQTLRRLFNSMRAVLVMDIVFNNHTFQSMSDGMTYFVEVCQGTCSRTEVLASKGAGEG